METRSQARVTRSGSRKVTTSTDNSKTSKRKKMSTRKKKSSIPMESENIDDDDDDDDDGDDDVPFLLSEEKIYEFHNNDKKKYSLKSGFRFSFLGLKEWYLLSFDDLPFWLQDNQYILHSYRAPYTCWSDIFRSLFYIHNQTGNIYSHILAGLVIFGMMIYTYGFGLEHIFKHHYNKDKENEWDNFMELSLWLIFFLAAMTCYFSSSAFHLCLCQSHDALQYGSRCDYLGIVVMTYGSLLVTSWYCLYRCHKWLFYGYAAFGSLVTIPLVLAICNEFFYKPSFRTQRAVIFVVFGLVCGTPIFHSGYLVGFNQAFNVLHFHLAILEAGCYIVGAAIFAAQIPEKWYPGTFDILFHSHQIHHGFASVAGFLHFYYLNILARDNHKLECLP